MKKFFFLFLFFALFFLFFLIENDNIKKNLRPYYHKSTLFFNNLISEKIKVLFYITNGSVDYRTSLNDYNSSFLPNTELIQLKHKSININLEKSTNLFDYLGNNYNGPTVRPSGFNYFLINQFNDNNILLTFRDNSFYVLNLELLNSKNNIELRDALKLNSNLKSNKILDALIHKDKLYVSYSHFEESINCSVLRISVSNISKNTKDLKFEDYMSFNECAEQIWAGRLQYILFDNYNGLIVTTSDTVGNLPTFNSQKKNSIFGKVLYIDENTRKSRVFSMGHRNAQGLLVNNDKKFILSTEHGPRGGDEINLILEDKNYGWPIYSYGKPYLIPPVKNLRYEQEPPKNKKEEFEQPIFAFVPSIGISEIIEIPNNFNPEWQDNFFISSLSGEALYRIKFDTDKKKTLFYEKIFIGQRIRDLIYSKELNSFYLSLEDYKTGKSKILIISNLNK